MDKREYIKNLFDTLDRTNDKNIYKGTFFELVNLIHDNIYSKGLLQHCIGYCYNVCFDDINEINEINESLCKRKDFQAFITLFKLGEYSGDYVQSYTPLGTYKGTTEFLRGQPEKYQLNRIGVYKELVLHEQKRGNLKHIDIQDVSPELFPAPPIPPEQYVPNNADMNKYLKKFIEGFSENTNFADCAIEYLKSKILRTDLFIIDEKGVWDCEGIRARIQRANKPQAKYPIPKHLIDPAMGGVTKAYRQTEKYLRAYDFNKDDLDQWNKIKTWLEDMAKTTNERHEIPIIIALFCKKYHYFKADDIRKLSGVFAYNVKNLMKDITGKDEPSESERARVFKALEILKYIKANNEIIAPFIFTELSKNRQYINVTLTPLAFTYGHIITPIDRLHAITEGQTDKYRAFALKIAFNIAFRYANKAYPIDYTYKNVKDLTKYSERFIKDNIENVLIDLKDSKHIIGYEKQEQAGKKTNYRVIPFIFSHVPDLKKLKKGKK